MTGPKEKVLEAWSGKRIESMGGMQTGAKEKEQQSGRICSWSLYSSDSQPVGHEPFGGPDIKYLYNDS